MKKDFLKGLGIFLGLLVALVYMLSNVTWIQAATTYCFPSSGCLGTSTPPVYGQVPVGNAGGTYTLTSTSTLGIGFNTVTNTFSTTTTPIYIDSNRTDSYTADGSIFRPYKTITTANAGVVAKGLTSAVYYIAPGAGYAEQSMTLPNIPLVVYDQGASIILLSGASVGAGTMTIPNDISFYDGVIFGNVIETDTSLTNPHTFTNSFVAGNFNGKGNVTFGGGAIVDQNTAVFPFLSRSASSTIMVQPGSISNFNGDNIQSIIWNAGILNLDDVNVAVSTSTSYAITSTTTGSVVDIVGMSLSNLSTGGGINIQNGATASNGNFLSSFGMILGAGTVNAINAGTAVSYVGPYTAYTTAGVRLYATGSGLSPSSYATIGVEGTSTLALNGGTAGVGTTTPGAKFAINNVATDQQAQPLFLVASSTATATTTSFIITNTGNVGIGTSAPTFNLDIRGGGTTLFQATNFGFGGSVGGAGLIGHTGILPSAQGDRLGFLLFGYTTGGAGTAGVNSVGMDGFADQAWTTGVNQGSYMTFGTTPNNTTTRLERMRIASNGFVGVSAPSPQALLDVGGQFTNVAGVPFTTNPIGAFSTSTNAVSGVAMTNTSNGTSADFRFVIQDPTQHYLAFASPGTGNTGILFGQVRSTGDFIFNNSGTGRNLIVGTVAANDLIFGTNNVENVRIKSGGNFGIGTSSPFALLSLAGAAGGTSPLFTISTSTSAFATSTAFVVTSNGNVGIGTTTPPVRLSVNGGLSVNASSTIGDGSASGGLTVSGVATTTGNAYFAGLVGINTSIASLQANTHTFDVTSPGGTQNIVSLIRPTNTVNNFLQFQPNGGNTTTNVNWLMGTNSNSDNFSFGLYDGSSVKTKFTIVDTTGAVGISTSTPYATLSVQSGASTGDAFAVATTTNTLIGGYDNDGHQFTAGPAPAISSCGTGTGTVVGDDQSGTITTATAATACTMTFSKAYRNTPTCVVTDNSLVGFADISSISTTAVTFGISSALTSGNLYYSCTYHK